MNIKSFFKKLFGIAKKDIEVVVETKVEPAETYVKQKIQEIDVEKATKAIETRLAEIAEDKKAVTAKDIKAKVKKAPEAKSETKPATKSATKGKAKSAKTEKPATKPASRKKTDK
jgi:hypothetical protein